MFAFHETTRKRVCRTAFFALCVAPTLATAVWVGGHYVPGRKGRTTKQLGAALDAHVKLADWRNPRPRMVRSTGLVLSDPASGHALANITEFEQRRTGGGLVYSAKTVTVEAAQFDRLAPKLDSWIGKLPPDAHIVGIGRLIVTHSGGADYVLHHVQGRIDRDRAGRVRAQFAGQVDDGQLAPSGTVRITLEPSPTTTSAARVVTLDASSAPIPASLLRSFVPGIGELGESSHFCGVVRWAPDQPKVHGIVQGRLDRVDLPALLPVGSPHRVHGSASLVIDELSWRGPHIERLAGTIRAENAQASRSLIEAAVSHFRCAQHNVGTTVPGDAEMVSLDQLAVRFQLDANGLRFWGGFPTEANLPKGCLATSGRQPLLVEPNLVFHPAVLVQAFAAPAATWLPASREALHMAERLPLPQPRPANEAKR